LLLISHLLRYLYSALSLFAKQLADDSSLGHILSPPFLFLGLHRNKKPPRHSGRRLHQNKTHYF
jgi:hypothetical protein